MKGETYALVNRRGHLRWLCTRQDFVKTHTVILAALCLVLFAASPLEALVCATGYAFCDQITVDHTKVGTVSNTDQSAFPVGFIGTYAGSAGSPDLRTIGNGGKVLHTATQPTNGLTVPADVLFTDCAGSTLNFEITYYVASTGQIEAYVNIATLSHTSDTSFCLNYSGALVTTYQGNDNATWNSAFVAITHCTEVQNAALTTCSDSTSNGNTVTSVNAANIGISSVTGIAGKGVGLSGGGQSLLSKSTTTSLPTGTTARTLEHWYNHNGVNFNSAECSVGWGNISGNGNGFFYQLNNNSGTCVQLSISGDNEFKCDGSAYYTGWHHLVNTLPSGTVQNSVLMYLDGVQLTGLSYFNGGTTLSTVNSNYTIGGIPGNGGQPYAGSVDEIRVSNVARSADWIVTTYNNLNSPSTFYSLGAVVGSGGNMVPAVY